MGRKRKLKTEKMSEDWCFVCKDGGFLRVCDYRDCIKAYHPECVGKDDSLLEAKEKWKCNLHSCFECGGAPKFYCLCCPFAICGHCIGDAEFAIVIGKKGLCDECLEHTLLIEEKKDVNSHGCKIDSGAPDTIDYFYEYWLIIKDKERLTSEQVISAYNLWKRGEHYTYVSDSFESDEEEDNIGKSEDDCQIRKRKRSIGKLSVTKSKVKSNRKEFNGWGSKPLLEFLAFFGKDTTQELSDDVVTTIILKYCKENKLFHPERKRKVICDARLRALFGRKSVNKNSIHKLLYTHFAENLEHLEEELGSSSENEDEDDSTARKRQSSSVKESDTKKVVVDVQKSSFASIVPKNIKLVYLRKSLVEELSKQLETFDAKVMGSFVRVRSDPNDYLQKNSHQLVQVAGVRKTSMNAEILLEVSNRVKGVPICKLSDNHFSEEECEDLRQRVKNGLVNRPTVVELGQKAGSLHEDITKHWIARELVLIRKLIDRANEKGWRRELYEYMDKLHKLQTPSEQSRLLNEIPEVIAEMVQLEPDCEDTTGKDENEDYDSSPESSHKRTCKNPAWNLKSSRESCHLNDSTDAAAKVTKGKTQIIAPSGLQYRVGSHNEASGSVMSCVGALQACGGGAPNSAADLVADGLNEMNKRDGENSNEVAQEHGKAIEMHNSR